MLSTSFYEVHELKNIGLRQFGDNVHISRNARFYCPEKILIGNNVRLDDFCILSGKVEIGDYVHVSSSTTLTGGVAGIIVEEFANID